MKDMQGRKEVLVFILFVALVWITFMSCLGARTAAADEWSPLDVTLQAAVLSTIIIDMNQTMGINDRPDLIEANPFLGTDPSDQMAVAFISGSMIAHTMIANRLSGWKRTVWQLSVLAAEVAAVTNNFSNGLSGGNQNLYVSYTWTF